MKTIKVEVKYIFDDKVHNIIKIVSASSNADAVAGVIWNIIPSGSNYLEFKISDYDYKTDITVKTWEVS